MVWNNLRERKLFSSPNLSNYWIEGSHKLNTYTQAFSADPKSGGESVAVLERDSSCEELDLFKMQPFTIESSFLGDHCKEEVVVIKGKITISF